jgi:hypothetical protein
MKTTAFILMISVLTGVRLAQNNPQNSNASTMDSCDEIADTSLLNFYLQTSSFTDPGAYTYLYENLPDSLPELCHLIKSQFIHPHAELPKFRDQIPEERWNESLKYPTVKLVLEGLLSHDPRGLVADRKPEDRLVLGCRHYAILLASVLKHRGIPARVRYGHATYLIPGFHASHVVCEVWNEYDKRWMLVDPGTGLIDFSREKFDFSHDAWLELQNGDIDPNMYGSPGKGAGMISILSKISLDLASLLGTEYTIYQYAPVMEYALQNNNQLTSEHIETLNRICELMKPLDSDQLSKLQAIYTTAPDIQISKTYSFSSGNSGNGTGSGSH